MNNEYMGYFYPEEINALEWFSGYTFWKTSKGVEATHISWPLGHRLRTASVYYMYVALLTDMKSNYGIFGG